MLAILACYLAEVLYYFSRSMADGEYQAPHHAAIRCLGMILIWIPLTSSLLTAETAHWHPYFGAFVLQFSFETITCLMRGRGIGLSQDNRYTNVPLAIGAVRGFNSLLLAIDASFILVSRVSEKGADEEGQSLLGAPQQNGNADYGSIPQSDSDDEEFQDGNKEIKEQQAKRLEEQGGWFGYIKSFAIFLPYLFPRHDWRVMLCLFLRLLNLLSGRVFNLLTPRQLGIITNKLSSGTNVMPWKDVGLWAFYNWFHGYSGLGIVDSFADTYIRNSAFERITMLAYGHLMTLSMDFHTTKDSGEVLKAVEQASSLNQLIEMVLFDIIPVLLDMFIAMAYVTVLFDSYMAFIIMFMGLAYVWIGFKFTTWSQPHRRTYVERQRTENNTVTETITNWATVAYFNRVPFESDRYRSNIKSTIWSHYQYFFRSLGGHAVQDLLTTLAFSACCIFAISQIISGKKPVGNLVTFIMYWGTMMSPLYTMSYSYRYLSSTLIDAERLVQLLNTKSTVSDAENARDLVVKAGKVEFKNVQFFYDPRKEIIRGANLVAEGGQTIAFVGETGGGKSTMLKLLFRFYDVTGGSIMIDGQDLRSVTLSSVREALGLVPQDPALFNQTIRQNVRYARLDASDAEIEDACRAAAIHDDIVSFPDGYNSKVGERGVRLSGGQLQRIAIARVFLKNPKIVLLDEATSAIDSTIESQIQGAFKKLSAGRTTFVIAHRLSTIADANMIIVVDKGEIIERGTHSELLEIGGKYAELWTKQTAGNTSPADSNSTNGDVNDGVLIDITPDEDDDSAKTTGRSQDGNNDSVERRR
ncbi:heavy metal tolerance protein precursor [Massariosphaeria phaeospora]|uniref:Heavy metal tolerance protein n=1 Tax=Massariosphaeria phaeospora TaxID=100035 RepID=A0A7C8MD41_9PLEO|nr:heavy metal tolerance protein precursor [Massariosphaeria phaeospora]